MLNSGKCPKCGEVVSSVRIEDVDVSLSSQITWRGVSYCCPSCNAVLSVQIDPVALKTDIINVIMEEIGKRPRR